MNNGNVVTVVLLTLSTLVPAAVFAAVMTSSSYQIQSDSINIGGGLGTSSSYILEDTLGEIATGISTSSSYTLSAGYQQMQESYIAISAAADISLSNISGVIAASSTASTSWSVVTDSVAGYELSVKATSTPALQASAGYSFADYEDFGVPDFTLSVPATTSMFAFSPEGTDIVQLYQDNGATCNIASGDTTHRCWDGFSTSDTLIASSATSNHPGGATTTLVVAAENGSNHIQEAGDYTATLVVTAVAL